MSLAMQVSVEAAATAGITPGAPLLPSISLECSSLHVRIPQDQSQRAVPILVEPHRTLWETDAVACRLSELVGSDFWRRGTQTAEMVMWLSWSAHHLNRAGGDLYFHRVSRPTFSDEQPDPAVLAEAEREFRTHAAILDAQLEGRTWLVGNQTSYADFRVASTLPFTDAARLPLAGLAQVKRWHDQLLEIDAWRAPFDGLAA